MSFSCISFLTILYYSILYDECTCAAKCNQPVTDDSVRVIFDDPTLIDSNATFTCPDEKVLIGPNASTCMDNGYWEPDPRGVECQGE